MLVTIHTDGGSRGNPGPAATGYVIDIPDQDRIEYGEYIGSTTNNVAEYTAILQALTRLETAVPNASEVSVELKLDSELAQKQLTGIYKIKNAGLKPIAQQILNKVEVFESVTFTHVKRAFNKDADAQVNLALDSLT